MASNLTSPVCNAVVDLTMSGTEEQTLRPLQSFFTFTSSEKYTTEKVWIKVFAWIAAGECG